MTASPLANIREHFGTIEDPRVDRTKLHSPIDIIVIAICVVVIAQLAIPISTAFSGTSNAWRRPSGWPRTLRRPFGCHPTG